MRVQSSSPGGGFVEVGEANGSVGEGTADGGGGRVIGSCVGAGSGLGVGGGVKVSVGVGVRVGRCVRVGRGGVCVGNRDGRGRLAQPRVTSSRDAQISAFFVSMAGVRVCRMG